MKRYKTSQKRCCGGQIRHCWDKVPNTHNLRHGWAFQLTVSVVSVCDYLRPGAWPEHHGGQELLLRANRKQERSPVWVSWFYDSLMVPDNKYVQSVNLLDNDLQLVIGVW